MVFLCEFVEHMMEEVVEDDNSNDTILKEEQIKQLQDSDTSEVSNVLSVPRGLANSLLVRQNWNAYAVFDEWFTDEERVRDADEISAKSSEVYCKICLENMDVEIMLGAACGHLFCAPCLKTYISISINDGPGCLMLHCPEPNCMSPVGVDLVDRLASVCHTDKYSRHLYRSYIECSSHRKWCPAPECDFGVEFCGCNCKSYEVTCDCSHKFCWICVNESHRPLDCKKVAEWLKKKDISQVENIIWILNCTKSCPQCYRRIEKYEGCNHMVCPSPCGFHFCWECLGSWVDHDNYFSCNKSKERTKRSDLRTRKQHFDEYTYHYKRWDMNDTARKSALDNLGRAKNNHIHALCKVQGEPYAGLQFVTETWEQIVECRRVLGWIYAYGYFLSSVQKDSRKMNFFEFRLGEAQAILEKLHHCAHKEMETYLYFPRLDFKDFRAKLIDLTSFTKNYFENFLKALENNLCEVE